MKKLSVLFLLVILICITSTSAGYSLTDAHKRPTIGLALGEGGMRGFVHIGVIKVLSENGYKIDYIAGTSIGSMVGGLYSLWNDINKVEDFMLNIDFNKFVKVGSNALKLQKFGEEAYFTINFDLINKKTTISLLSGLINSVRIRDTFDELTNRALIDYDLSIPYKAIATDLISGKKIIMGSGRLSNAMVGSSCVPGFFTPLPYGNMYLVDGGLKEPVPVNTARNMGADIVIAVSLRGVSTENQISVDNVVPIIERSMYIMIEDRTKEAIKEADILIAPHIKVKSLEFNMSKKERLRLIKLGEKMMKNALPLLEEKINNY